MPEDPHGMMYHMDHMMRPDMQHQPQHMMKVAFQRRLWEDDDRARLADIIKPLDIQIPAPIRPIYDEPVDILRPIRRFSGLDYLK